MDELHWTGAALLLALAISDGPVQGPRRARTGSTRPSIPRRTTAALPPPDAKRFAPAPRGGQQHPRPGAAPRQPHHAAPSRVGVRWVWAPATCGHCGREAGALEWDAARAGRLATLRPSGEDATRLVDLDRAMRCGHCRGPVFVEEPRPVSRRPPVALEAWGGEVAPRRAG